MSIQVIWTSKVLEFFIKEANLNELEEAIMRSRVRGDSRTKQAADFNISTATLDRIIKRLKLKYDALQNEYPDTLPKRKSSAEETFMDTH